MFIDLILNNIMSDVSQSPLKVGDKAPDFSGFDQSGNRVQLADFKGKKLVLFFYPKDNTPGCTAEVCNLRDNHTDFKRKGYALLGVSADSQSKHQNFIKKFDLPFPLLADTEKEVIKAYGAWGRKKFMGKEYDGILRSTFVIDESGMIEDIIQKVKTKDHTSQILGN
jgi:peroxiredoxin Q/BCP